MAQRSLVFRLAVCFFLICAASCGYRPVGRGELTTGTGRPTLAIPLFANSFIETFRRSQALRVVARPENADLVLDGKIASVAYSSVAYFNINRSLVRRVTIRVEVQLTRRSTGKVVWKDQAIVQEDYVFDQTYQESEALKNLGVRRGAVTLARKMLDKVLLVI